MEPTSMVVDMSKIGMNNRNGKKIAIWQSIPHNRLIDYAKDGEPEGV